MTPVRLIGMLETELGKKYQLLEIKSEEICKCQSSQQWLVPVGRVKVGPGGFTEKGSLKYLVF